MHDKNGYEKIETLNVLMDDDFISGRIHVYQLLLSLLTGEARGEDILSKIKLLSTFLNLNLRIKQNTLTEFNQDKIINLRATNYLDLSDIQKEAYLINLNQFYSESGYIYSGNYPIDHLAVQVLFLLNLTREMLGKNVEEKIEALKLQSRFIGTHILPWLSKAKEENLLANICFNVLSIELELFRDFFTEFYSKKS